MKKEQLEAIAREVGLDALGVAPARRAQHAEVFHAWLAEGCHAMMDWLAREPERRCDPELVLPGAKSVIVLAMNYYVPDKIWHDGAIRGRIARYARGRDYHHVISKRLRAFDHALTAQGGRQKCFVDTGPILERDFSVSAGIAWHGKSTLVIHPKLGTWFFLAAVITTLELEVGTPMPDHCGKCTRCIEACPTNAIVAPHKVDARRCLSYWTIEHKGSLPEWIRPLLGDRIFGCDDCLDVCPWNRFAQASRETDFAARSSSHWPLRDYLSLDEAGFRKLFEGSPIRRAGWQGFLRNVCTALGNVGSQDDMLALKNISLSSDPIIAEHAAWAIGRIRDKSLSKK